MVPFPGKEGTRPVGTGAERRRGGAGATPRIPNVVELDTIEPGVRADLATQGGSTFTFDWYALIARTRLLRASAPFWGGVGWGGTSARPKRLKTASASAYFRISLGLQSFGLTHGSVCLLYYILGFTLLFLAARRPAHSLWPASLHPFTLRGGVKHRTSR